jgi:histidinol-phosphatase
MNYTKYLDFATDLAHQAGKVTLKYYQTGVSADFKADKSPVTVADKDTEIFIRQQIEKAFPDHGLIGEEFGKDERGQTYRWIIDPIDGTKSFMRGVPLYAVLIGLEVEGVVRVGAAYFPALDEMLCAADGEGCWWNGHRAYVSKVSEIGKAMICFTSLQDLESTLGSAWVELKETVYELRGWSDSYGYLAVATGRAEAVLDPVMKIWDCGPFPPIFREAGGFFGNWQGVEGHTFGEALACNKELLQHFLSIMSKKKKPRQ